MKNLFLLFSLFTASFLLAQKTYSFGEKQFTITLPAQYEIVFENQTQEDGTLNLVQIQHNRENDDSVNALLLSCKATEDQSLPIELMGELLVGEFTKQFNNEETSAEVEKYNKTIDGKKFIWIQNKIKNKESSKLSIFDFYYGLVDSTEVILFSFYDNDDDKAALENCINSLKIN